MSNAKSAQLSIVGMIHTPKGASAPVAYVQLVQGDKKVGSYIRADYVRYMLANPADVQSAIKTAESLLPAPAPVAAAPAAAAPAPAADVIAALMLQMQQMQQALGLVPAAAPAPAPAPAPVASAPAPAPVAAGPLNARAAQVRAAARR